MNNHFTYRDASQEDIPQLIHLGLLAYGQYTPQLTEVHAHKQRQNISNNDMWIDLVTLSKSFLCMDKNRIIGMAFIMPSDHPWDIFKGEWTYIRMVGVDPAYQGRGIAKSLMNMCIQHARDNNEKTIALHTSDMMEAARHIYEQLGFRILHEVEPRLGKRFWIYTLDLK